MMLLNRDSTIQSSSRRFCIVYKSEKSDPLQPSGRHDIPFGRSSVKASSVRTTRTFRSDAHQCLETSNCSRLQPSGRNGKSFGRYSEFEKILAFKCIRPDDVAKPSGRHSVFDKSNMVSVSDIDMR
jgi:hypothetical protein